MISSFSFLIIIIVLKLIGELGIFKLTIEKLIYHSKYNFDSKIFKSVKKIKFILDHIKENDKSFNFNNIKLLYRGSRNGDRTKTCHELCDNKQNILIIIKTDTGYIFGGYTKIGFKNSTTWRCIRDNNSFLFSKTLKKIYPVIKDKRVLSYDDDDSYGLCFCFSLCFRDNFMNKNNNYFDDLIKYHFNGLNYDYEMNGCVEKFYIKELEVFQLL